MQLNCPDCNAEIDNSKINVTTDLVQCSACNNIYKLSEMVDKPSFENPPKGSSILLKKIGDQIEVELPNKRVNGSYFGLVLFTILWLSFISFWTWGTLQKNIYFAMFSIPFWLIGGIMIIGLLNNIFEKQKLILGSNFLILERNKVETKVSIEYSLDEIYSIEKQQLKLNGFGLNNYQHFIRNPSSVQFGRKLPAISSGIDTEYFFEQASHAEQDWIITFLKAWVNQHKQKAL